MMDETSEDNMLPLDDHLVVINTTVQSPENPNKINQQTQGPCDMMSTGWQFPHVVMFALHPSITKYHLGEVYLISLDFYQ